MGFNKGYKNRLISKAKMGICHKTTEGVKLKHIIKKPKGEISLIEPC